MSANGLAEFGKSQKEGESNIVARGAIAIGFSKRKGGKLERKRT